MKPENVPPIVHCVDCIYCVVLNNYVGECHRHPPFVLRTSSIEEWDARFPLIDLSWCGDGKRKDTTT